MCASTKTPLDTTIYNILSYERSICEKKILALKTSQEKRHHSRDEMSKKTTTGSHHVTLVAGKACGGPTDTDFLFNYFLQFIAEPTASPVTTMPYSIPNSYRKALTGMTGAGDVGASLVVSNALLCPYAHETLVSLGVIFAR